ncbi:MAG: hypothetical protein V9F04_03845 [Dermatophilaceae bacterium]
MSMTKAKKSDGRESEARRLRRELFTDEMLDQLMAATDERGLRFPPKRGGIDNEDCDVREENEVRPGVP